MGIEIKVEPESFEAIRTGARRFDVRNEDKSFKVGDMIRLREYEPKDGAYTGREYHDVISCILYPQDILGVLTQPSACIIGWRGPDEEKVQALIDELCEAAEPDYLKEVLDRLFTTKEELERYDLESVYDEA